jgi:DNA-binding MarR family transcriptional regulator
LAELLQSGEQVEKGSESASLLSACVDTLERVTPRLGKVIKSRMKDGPLTMQQMMMLREIHDGARPGELSRRCGISSSATTAALDALVRDGYCIREHSETDRREVVVHTTAAGAEALAAAQSESREAIRELLAGWDERRMQRLLAVLHDLDGAVNGYVEHLNR